MKKFSSPLFSALVIGLAGVSNAQAAGRDTISIVGSSTVYPFATVVAERFGKMGHPTPKIESTGSGGGMKLFCKGTALSTPDITNASRRIKKSEYQTCHKNGLTGITEVKIGYDGIIVANSKAAPRFKLTRRDLFLGLARQVPAPDGSHKLVANPYKTWRQVDPNLPNEPIEVLGPPPTSGTRDAFAELAMEGGCKSFPWIKAIKHHDKKRYKAICHGMREDGAYIEAGENDNLIVQKLEANPRALGVFGYSFLEQNEDRIQGSLIDGVAPEFESISDGSYPVSRPLFFYVKHAHVGKVPGIRAYVQEFTTEAAIGDDGYLVDKGLIPMSAQERATVRRDARALKNLEL